MQILRGVTPTAPKIIIHGLPGVGKSTLASHLKKPIFLDVEGGLNYIGCDRTPQIHDDRTMATYLVELYRAAEDGKKVYDTVVIDSIDWMVRKYVERAAGIIDEEVDKVTKKIRKKVNYKGTLNKANGGYGGGAEYLETLIRTDFIPRLDRLVSYGYGVCLIAHSERQTMMSEDGFGLDRIAPKIHKKISTPFIEWADEIFYLKHGTGEERVLVLSGTDDIVAKNRIGLVGEVSLDKVDINDLLDPTKKDKITKEEK